MNVRTDHVGDIVAQDFRTATVFKKFGIDFCCNGSKTIEEACLNKNLNQDEVISALENLQQQQKQTTDYNAWALDFLANYIENTHHKYVAEKTPILQELLDKLCKVHGDHHPELFEVTDLFNQAAKDMAAHMKKEELILFPFIKNMVKAKTTGSEMRQPRFGSVENPVDMMTHDHTQQGEIFDKIKALTNHYTTPADGCNTYQVTFKMLEEFEDDLHTHIHLENNILFPKAVQMEKEISDKIIAK